MKKIGILSIFKGICKFFWINIVKTIQKINGQSEVRNIHTWLKNNFNKNHGLS